MANEEHVAILRQGVGAWNAWRSAHTGVLPDLINADLRAARLQEADLINADLRGADLSDADLRYANLSSATLRKAILSGATLRGATLRKATLSGADLRDVDLSHSNLSGADLHGAKLIYANLSGADLAFANVSRATLSLTIIGNVDLSMVEGLDQVFHIGPSTIGLDTIFRSQGKLPESFLRGAGVPETFIEYMHALVAATQPIEFYSCFISYSSQDAELAERLHADLQAARVRCWFAPHDLQPGEVIVSGIDQAIRVHEKVLLLLSEASVASSWVAHEAQLALTREAREGRNVLFPVRLDDSVLDAGSGWARTLREARHIGDFREWKEHDAYTHAFQRLLRDLSKTVEAHGRDAQ